MADRVVIVEDGELRRLPLREMAEAEIVVERHRDGRWTLHKHRYCEALRVPWDELPSDVRDWLLR